MSFSRLAVGAVAIVVSVVMAAPSTLGLTSHDRDHVGARIAATADAAGVAVSQAWVRQTHLVNYYPAKNGWSRMWTHWHPATIGHDLSRAKSIGANTVRIITFPYTMGWPKVHPAMERHLKSILAMAKQRNLQIQLTLFDFWGQYGQRGKSRRWTRTLLRPIAHSPALRFIEVQNEVDLTRPGIVPWIESEITAIHRVAPGVPVTVSPLHQLGGLVSLTRALRSPKPDFWDLHYYGSPEQAYRTFGIAKRAAAPRPLLVGEGGLPSDPATDDVATMVQARDAQVDWFNVVDAAARARGLGAVAPWTLLDFTSTGANGSTSLAQYRFGMYTAAGKAKPVAGVVRQAFTGSLVPHVLNPGFVPLPDGSGIPALWHPWFVSGTMGVAAGRGLSGGNALAFAHTVHQSGGASSFYAIPMQPVIYGQTWTASVMARGRNATGTTLIQLAWYDRNGHWLGSANSRNLTLGTTSWAPLRVTSQVPDHAAAVRIFLQSSTNSGSAYFAKPSWSVS